MELIEIYSEIFIKLGEVEKKYELPLTTFQGKDSQKLLQMFSPEVSPEKLGYFFKLALILAQMGGNLKNINALDPDKKIALGKELKSAIQDYHGSNQGS